MKSYAVIITPEAESNIVEAFHYIYQSSPRMAEKWLIGLHREVGSLERMPARCGAAREREYLGEDVRQLLYQSHRFIFRIEAANKIVRVLYVRHAKQRAFGEPEKPDNPEEPNR